MTQAASRRPTLPPGLVAATVAVIVGTMVLATLGHDAPRDPASAGGHPMAVRDLAFADRDDGAVVVTDVRSGRAIEVLPPGEEGFVRGAMRGLARERRRASIAPEVPFRLSAWPDGRLTLQDTGNGNIMELHAFGRTNAEAFLRLLSTEE